MILVSILVVVLAVAGVVFFVYATWLHIRIILLLRKQRKLNEQWRNRNVDV